MSTYQSSTTTNHDPMTDADSLHSEMEKYQRYIDPKNRAYLQSKIKEKLEAQFHGDDLEAKVRQQYDLIVRNAREKLAELSKRMTELEERHPELTVDLGLADRDEELAVHKQEPMRKDSNLEETGQQQQEEVHSEPHSSVPPKENPVVPSEPPKQEPLPEDTFQRVKKLLNYEIIEKNLGNLDSSILPQDPTSVQKRLEEARIDLGEACQMIIRDWQAFDSLLQFRLNSVFGELQSFFSQAQLPRETYTVELLNTTSDAKEQVSVIEERGIEVQDILVYLLTKSSQTEDPVEKQRSLTLAQHLFLMSSPYTSSHYDLDYIEPVEWERARLLYDTRLVKDSPQLATGNHQLNEELAYYVSSNRRVLSLNLVPRVIVPPRPKPVVATPEVSVPALQVDPPKVDAIPLRTPQPEPVLVAQAETSAASLEIPTEAKVFLTQLLRDSGETLTSGPSEARLKALYMELSGDIAQALASKIPPEQLDTYKQLIARATDPVEIQTFIRSQVPDAARLIIAVMDRFRRDYLDDKNADLV